MRTEAEVAKICNACRALRQIDPSIPTTAAPTASVPAAHPLPLANAIVPAAIPQPPVPTEEPAPGLFDGFANLWQSFVRTLASYHMYGPILSLFMLLAPKLMVLLASASVKYIFSTAATVAGGVVAEATAGMEEALGLCNTSPNIDSGLPRWIYLVFLVSLARVT